MKMICCAGALPAARNDEEENRMKKVKIATWSELDPKSPAYALVANVDLVIVRWPDEEEVSVLYGRCKHRGALMADGTVRGDDLV